MSASFFSSLRLLVGLVVRTAPGRSAALFALAVAEGLLTPAVIAVTGLAVARGQRAAGSGSTTAAHALMAALVLVGVVFAVGQALAPVRDAFGQSIGSMVAQGRRERLLAASLRPAGVAHLEDPELADEIRRAGEIEWDVGPLTRIVGELGKMITLTVGAIGAAVLLARLAWWTPVVLFALAIATHALMHGTERDQVVQTEEHATSDRRADYFLDLALAPPAAKEVRLFGLAGFLADRAHQHRLQFLQHVWRARWRNRKSAVVAAVAVGVAVAAVLGQLGASTVSGRIDASDLTVFVQAIVGITLLTHGSGAVDFWWVYEGAATIPHLLRLERRELAAPPASGALSAAAAPRQEVRLEGIQFGYPGRPVLTGLDLTIPAGSSLAIVGANGAGKTTVLKLLARLYEPDAGRIVVDGHDLRDYDLASWRRQLAVIFADFVRYELSARDNVALGDADDDRLRRAADRAGALDLVESLPSGWQTPLARQYRGGVDLSGGQWQRIALARALRAAEAGARLLVLDEPTANLDIRAEADLFGHFLELTAGTTTLLVTHRLSTVRHADRIAVLTEGRVAEIGSHHELMAAGGRYARMFALQAARFMHGTGKTDTDETGTGDGRIGERGIGHE